MTRVLRASLLAALALARPASADDRLYDGSRGQLAVDMPRVEEAEVRIDGDLAEPIWQEAAILTGFTQMEPVEGGAASERTEVLLFYTPRALYIGVRAYTSNPARIRATLAERDKIVRDDHIQILLDTFLDRRRAYALYVNPLGIQQDGIYNEAGGRR
ncbi:MAG TPA: carbohydrate binding family 9 domain-containing protein, partial [Longimicrobiaceae bacterium]|nr:carbohydrate binding family 9 domain-containing protein [Longimicrobiaceae bacterium]